MTLERPADATAASEADSQRRVLDFLDGTGFGAAKGGRRIDTHASVVFLGNDLALKIKRAVRLPFLDYSTLEKRRRACKEELRVNAGNAPELYRRVVAITRRNDGAFEIGGSGLPVEWAVEMVRFDEEKTLDRIAAARPIEPSLAAALADTILQSHDKASRANGKDWLGSIPSIIDRNTAKFRAESGLDVAVIDRLDARSHGHVTTHRILLGRRAGQGFVRRCHGDLHLANIALMNGKPLLFDAIEFDPVISTTDILYDLAFTLMDLVHFGSNAAANTLFNRYFAGAAEENLDGLGLLPLFLSMRAAIRAHVLFTKSEQVADGQAARHAAKSYLDLAVHLVTPGPPQLVAVGGLSGTESRCWRGDSRASSSRCPGQSLSVPTSFASACLPSTKRRICRNRPIDRIPRGSCTTRCRGQHNAFSLKAARSCLMPPSCSRLSAQRCMIWRASTRRVSSACS